MSRTRTTPCTSFPSFPRVSGDEPLAGEVRELAARFSPRERG